jgi:hypothetical protein
MLRARPQHHIDKELTMARNTSRPGLRSDRRVVNALSNQQVLTVPAQRTDNADAYTWAVNAAMESGQTDLAYEIAAGFNDEA